MLTFFEVTCVVLVAALVLGLALYSALLWTGLRRAKRHMESKWAGETRRVESRMISDLEPIASQIVRAVALEWEVSADWVRLDAPLLQEGDPRKQLGGFDPGVCARDAVDCILMDAGYGGLAQHEITLFQVLHRLKAEGYGRRHRDCSKV